MEPDPRSRWEHYEHGADIGVRDFGATKAAAFEQAALALTAVIVDSARVNSTKRIELACTAPDDELLLAEWLNTLVHEMASRKMLFGGFRVWIDGERPFASAFGDAVGRARRHAANVEVKDATYRTLWVAQGKDGIWIAQTVVDV